METNGRVKFAPTNIPVPDTARPGMENPLMGVQEPTALSRTFFSDGNLEVIQRKLRQGVYQRTGQVVDSQDTQELRIVMRSIFLEYAKHRPDNIPGQIADLNSIVLDQCVDNVASAVESQFHYRKDQERNPMPLSHPVLMRDTGLKIPPIVKHI